MIRKPFVAILGVALMLGFVFIVPRARAGNWNQATQLTFKAPVELPGHKILPSGTYWFMLSEDISTSPNIVRILSADKTEVFGTFLTIPTTRAKSTNDTELTFAETGHGQAADMVRWFYPGRLTGHEFVYSPNEEAKLSLEAKINVMAQTSPLS